MVFWASFMRTETENEANQLALEKMIHLSREAFRKNRIDQHHHQSAQHRPTIGAITMKGTTLRIPRGISAVHPALATAAPAKPPTRACEELVGNPNHHVIKSHMMAPKSPNMTRYGSRYWA
jgi:hypothetical protein